MTDFEKFFVLYEPTEMPSVKPKGYDEVWNLYYKQESSELPDVILNPYLEDVLPVSEMGEYKQESSELPDVILFFIDKGLTENLARGIYGNLMLESQLNTSAISRDGHQSYGIALWTNDRKDRLFLMYGENPTLLLLLDYLWWELNNTEKSALNSLLLTDTVEDATRVFMDKFERPHKDYARLDKRILYAYNT